MILFISHQQHDYQDNVYFAFKKTFGDKVISYPKKQIWFSGHTGYTTGYFDFSQPEITEQDIINFNKNKEIEAIFIISSGCPIHDVAKDLLKKMIDNGGKYWPFVVIDGVELVMPFTV